MHNPLSLRLFCLALPLVAGMGHARAQAQPYDCARAGSPTDIMRCEEERLVAADEILDKEYRRLVRTLHDDPAPQVKAAMRTLIQAQREWIRFRDDDCDAVWLARPPGALREWYRLRCKRTHTEVRVEQLGRFRAD